MKVVVDIPEEWVTWIEQGCFGNKVKNSNYELVGQIMNGVVLPRNHGRLIDADSIGYTHSIARSLDDSHNWNELCATKDEIDAIPTIIEAESEVEE